MPTIAAGPPRSDQASTGGRGPRSTSPADATPSKKTLAFLSTDSVHNPLGIVWITALRALII